MLDKKAGAKKEPGLIHQIIELPLKRRNIVLGVFEISLECLQLMLLLLVGIVGYPGELRQLALKLLFPGPAVAKRSPQFTHSMHCGKPLSLIPSFPCRPPANAN
jgi:hypothetical protein